MKVKFPPPRGCETSRKHPAAVPSIAMSPMSPSLKSPLSRKVHLTLAEAPLQRPTPVPVWLPPSAGALLVQLALSIRVRWK
jgi:hypothetical protein